MTANQRRPGFRLPWSSEMDEPGGEAASGMSEAAAGQADEGSAQPEATTESAPAGGWGEPAGTGPEAPEADASAEGVEAEVATEAPSTEAPPDEPATSAPDEAPAPEAAVAADAGAAASGSEPADDFMRDLVAAMRRVADEARETTVGDLRAKADEQVRKLEADAERRREELRTRTEQDVAEVGEWAKAEAERIRVEAEQRVAARRTQLEHQLAGDTSRTEAETTAVRERLAEYERELDAYHDQLLQINDPAAFAAAAKRMPAPPSLTPGSPKAPSPATPPTDAPVAPASRVTSMAGAPAGGAAPVEPVQPQSNGVPEAATEVHPAEEEVLAARLAQLDATLPEAQTAPAGDATAAPSEASTTEVVVKGLGSFGAITGFRQALSGVAGIDGVALSLGQTGEFVFRATHAAGFDVRGAIAQLEGDGAKIEDRPEGGLRVTLERAR